MEKLKSGKEKRSKEEVYDTVREALIAVLGVGPDEIIPEAKIISDLGAESIDFLDLSFRIEQIFGVKLPTKEWTELFQNSSGQLSADKVIEALKRDYELSISENNKNEYSALSLSELVERINKDFHVEISSDRVKTLAVEGVRELVEGLEKILRTTVSNDELENIARVAMSVGTGPEFWSAVSDIFTVQRIVEYIYSSQE